MARPTLIERAYQLAESGGCGGIMQLRKRLQAEGYDQQALMGKALLDDLTRRCRVAAGKSPQKPSPPTPQTAEERSARSRKAAATRKANRPSLAEVRARLGAATSA